MGLDGLRTVARGVSLASVVVVSASLAALAYAQEQRTLFALILMGLVFRLPPLSRRWGLVGSTSLALTAAVMIGLAGGPAEPLLIALLLIVADLGTTARPLPAFVIGAAAAATVSAGVAVTGTTALTVESLWALALIPLVAAVTSQVVTRRTGGAEVEELESVTAALEEILRLAEHMPAGFDRWSVATAVQHELSAASGLPSSSDAQPRLLVARNGVLFGVGQPLGRRAVGLVGDICFDCPDGGWSSARSEQLPPALRDLAGEGDGLVAQLGRDGELGFVFLPAALPGRAHDAVTAVLRPAAIAMANVERFERLEELALSSARVRLAQDLHDGIAQSLTHVRFELDLLSLSNPDVADQTRSIRAVADAALLEVRRTVDELRDSAPLVDRLQRHVELVASFAPAQIALDVPATLDLDDATADEIFRIVQESLSNAVRHAGASVIHIRVLVDGGALTVLVADDGCGLTPMDAPGVGLSGLRDRARRLGGSISIRPRHGGGTVVQLETTIAATPVDADPTSQPVRSIR